MKVLIASFYFCLLCSSVAFGQCGPVEITRINLHDSNLSLYSQTSALAGLPADGDTDTDCATLVATTLPNPAISISPISSAFASAGPDIISATGGTVLEAIVLSTNGGSASSQCSNPLPPGEKLSVVIPSGTGLTQSSGFARYKVESLDVPSDQNDCTYTAELSIDGDLSLDFANGATYDHGFYVIVTVYEDENAAVGTEVVNLSIESVPALNKFIVTEMFNCSTEQKDPINDFSQSINDMSEFTGSGYTYTGPVADLDKDIKFVVKAGQVVEINYSDTTRVTATSNCPNGVTDSDSGSYQFVGEVKLEVNDKVLFGDANCDGVIDILDISDYVALLTGSGYKVEADINRDCVINALDTAPFVEILTTVCD